MTGIRVRGTLPVPLLSAFPELNVRTYVTVNNRPGVYFFSLDAASLPAVYGARMLYKLPYFYARMVCQDRAGEIIYSSRRLEGEASFQGRYHPVGSPEAAERGTLKHWLTERYCLYTVRSRKVYRADIHHQPWPLQDAEAEIEINTMASATGILLPSTPPILYFARKLQVVVWPLRSVS